MKSWYAIYVRPRSEKKVAAGLDEAGIENFLPLQRKLRRWSDRKKWVDMPLIPGYCFVSVEERDLINVLKFDNVVTVIRFNGKPSAIPDMQIEFLRRMLNQNEIAFKMSSEIPKPGQKVEIISGPFIGLHAEMYKEKNKSIIYLRLEQIQNVFLLEIPLDQVVLIANQDNISKTEIVF
jgi:transcription antitermination factor NusG